LNLGKIIVPLFLLLALLSQKFLPNIESVKSISLHTRRGIRREILGNNF